MSNSFLKFTALVARLAPAPVRRLIYRLGPISQVIRRALNRAAPSELTEISIAAGALAGFYLRLDLQSEKDYWLGSYETQLQAAILEFVKPGMVAYDLGAHIGYMTLLLARTVGPDGHVYAFEALPANLERLHTNLELNPQISWVTITPSAIVDRTGPIEFAIGPSGRTGRATDSAGQKISGLGSLTVPGISIDDFVYETGNPAPQIVKIDIEGGETLALKGMRRLLREATPLVFLELHGPECIQAAWEALKLAEYDLHLLRSGYPAVASLEQLDWPYILARPDGWNTE